MLDERQPEALHLISSNQLEFIEEIVRATIYRDGTTAKHYTGVQERA